MRVLSGRDNSGGKRGKMGVNEWLERQGERVWSGLLCLPPSPKVLRRTSRHPGDGAPGVPSDVGPGVGAGHGAA